MAISSSHSVFGNSSLVPDTHILFYISELTGSAATLGVDQFSNVVVNPLTRIKVPPGIIRNHNSVVQGP